MTITLTWSGFFEVVGMLTCGGLVIGCIGYVLFAIWAFRG